MKYFKNNQLKETEEFKEIMKHLDEQGCNEALAVSILEVKKMQSDLIGIIKNVISNTTLLDQLMKDNKICD